MRKAITSVVLRETPEWQCTTTTLAGSPLAGVRSAASMKAFDRSKNSSSGKPGLSSASSTRYSASSGKQGCRRSHVFSRAETTRRQPPVASTTCVTRAASSHERVSTGKTGAIHSPGTTS